MSTLSTAEFVRFSSYRSPTRSPAGALLSALPLVGKNVSPLSTPHCAVLQDNCTAFEAEVAAQCDALIQAIRARQEQLLLTVRAERQRKQDIYKEQLLHCSKRLQRATGLLEYSIEALKETDAGAFLQVRTCVRVTAARHWAA